MLTNDHVPNIRVLENNCAQEAYTITAVNGEIHRKPELREPDLQEPGEESPKHDLLLPVPDQEDVERFITLYQTQYGIELEPEQAHEILGGLMRFLYLTRRSRAEAPAQPQRQALPEKT